MKIINKISKIILLTALSFLFTNTFAQKDTTEIKLGKKKIIITEKKVKQEKKIENLEKAIETFEGQIKETENEIKDIEFSIKKDNELAGSSDKNSIKDSIDTQISEKEKQIAEKEKKIESFEKGIEGITEEIDKIEESIADIEEDVEVEWGDSTKRKHKKFKNLYHKSKFKGHWAGLELGLVNLTNSKSKIASDSETDFMRLDPEKSYHIALNIFEYNFPIYKKSFGILTGLGFEWDYFALNKDVDLSVENDMLKGTASAINYTKNKLSTTYMTIPIIFEYQIPAGKRKFHLGAGITGGLKLFSKQKQTYYQDGNKYKNKIRDDFELSPFRYAATVRLGYGPISLFANYSLSPLFKEGHAPELYPVSVGLRVLNF